MDSYNGNNEENVTHFSVNNTVAILEQNDDKTLIEATLDEEMLNNPMTEYPMNATMYATTSSEVGNSYFQDRTVYNNGAAQAYYGYGLSYFSIIPFFFSGGRYTHYYTFSNGSRMYFGVK